MAPALALIFLALGYLGHETRWFTIRLVAVPKGCRLNLLRIDRRLAAVSICFSLVPFFLSPVIVKDLFFGMPPPSEMFDCDDSVSLMYRKLTKVGIEARPFLGKLSVTGEEYGQSDHVWLLVKIGPWEVPFDWGGVAFGRQYFEGWAISPEMLQEFVQQDYRIRDSMPAESPSYSKLPAKYAEQISNFSIQIPAAKLRLQISSVD